MPDNKANFMQFESQLALYQEMVESSYDAILLLEGNRIIGANQAAYRMFGLSEEELLNTHPSELSPEFQEDGSLSADRAEALIQKANKGISQSFYWQHIRNGQEFTASITLNPAINTYLPDRGEAKRFVAVVRDVTDKRKAQQEIELLNKTLEQRVEERTAKLTEAVEELNRTRDELIRSEKMASLGRLVSGIAHELNTPIGNSMLVSSVLREQNEAFKLQVQSGLKRSALQQFMDSLDESTDIILRNLSQASELISSFKQIAIDQSKHERRSFNLSELILELEVTLTSKLSESNVQLSNHLDSTISMNSYPGAISQVFLNIIDNAIRHGFSEEKAGHIEVGTEIIDDHSFILTISDDGKGIDAEAVANIFDPFFTSSMGKNSGLGLHMVYLLVDSLLGGQISVESKPGSGTTFNLKLPFESAVVSG